MVQRVIIAMIAIVALSASHTALPAEAAIREYELAIERQEIDIAGSTADGLTVNGGIPGPTLRFTEGDTARIRVSNRLGEETSIHWHGLLVPPGMDGVPLISFQPIAPGATFTYEFPIRQSGTSWYHSHTALQEQVGVYGALVIAPRVGSPGAVRDHVVLLSDWTHEDAEEVNRTLKRGSDWYPWSKTAHRASSAQRASAGLAIFSSGNSSGCRRWTLRTSPTTTSSPTASRRSPWPPGRAKPCACALSTALLPRIFTSNTRAGQ